MICVYCRRRLIRALCVIDDVRLVEASARPGVAVKHTCDQRRRKQFPPDSQEFNQTHRFVKGTSLAAARRSARAVMTKDATGVEKWDEVRQMATKEVGDPAARTVFSALRFSEPARARKKPDRDSPCFAVWADVAEFDSVTDMMLR